MLLCIINKLCFGHAGETGRRCGTVAVVAIVSVIVRVLIARIRIFGSRGCYSPTVTTAMPSRYSANRVMPMIAKLSETAVL